MTIAAEEAEKEKSSLREQLSSRDSELAEKGYVYMYVCIYVCMHGCTVFYVYMYVLKYCMYTFVRSFIENLKSKWQSYRSEMESMKERLGQTEFESEQRAAELAAVREQAGKGRTDGDHVWQAKLNAVEKVLQFELVAIEVILS